MSDPFLGEIKPWAMDWAPRNWAVCDGSVIQITQNKALAALLGKQFGGDGQTTFALPDLRGRVAMGQASVAVSGRSVYSMGAVGGLEGVTLGPTQVPAHSHVAYADPVSGTTFTGAGAMLATAVVPPPNSAVVVNIYVPLGSGTPTVALATSTSGGPLPGTVSTEGGNAAHSNVQPFTVVNFAICVANGYWPPRP